MQITTHNIPTGTDETYSNTSGTSDDQDESDDDPIKKRPAIRFSETVLREDFFSSKLVRVSLRHLQTDTGKRKTTRQEPVEDENDWPTDPILPFDHCHYYYCHVPKRYVRTYKQTRSCQSDTSSLTGWSV